VSPWLPQQTLALAAIWWPGAGRGGRSIRSPEQNVPEAAACPGCEIWPVKRLLGVETVRWEGNLPAHKAFWGKREGEQPVLLPPVGVPAGLSIAKGRGAPILNPRKAFGFVVVSCWSAVAAVGFFVFFVADPNPGQ